MRHRLSTGLLFLAASSALAGCFQWGSRGVRHLPRTTALEQSYSYEGRVIVVGAGAAGLAAARVFEDNGVDYTVLEASDRYGGRLGKDEAFADFPVDLGAEWIHNLPTILDVLSGEEGTAASTELIPYRLTEAAAWDGETLRDATPYVEQLARFFPESKFKRSTWYDFASAQYGERVAHRIRYGERVASIDYSGDRVVVTTDGGAAYEADKVLVTVSIGVLRSGSLTFEPPMGEDKRAAIASVPFHRGLKALFRFTEDFYPDAVFFDVDEGEKGFYDVAFGKDTDDFVLGALVTGPSVEAYYALPSEEAMIDAMIDELDVLFDGKASETFTGDYILRDWGRNPHVLGTWVEGFRLSKRTVKALNEPLDDKVYFAGEAYDTYRQLGVPGAMLSGLHAADVMLTADR